MSILVLDREYKEYQDLKERVDMAINILENSALNKGICTEPRTDTIQTVLMVLKGVDKE